ncbi:MAG: hypothetical protein ACTJLN_02880 [Rickettsia amblyommatis]
MQLNYNSSFKPQTIEIHRKEALLKKFLERFKKNNFIKDEEQLSQFIKAACKEAKTPDGIEMQYGRALRLGSKYNVSKIDKQYSDLQGIFKKLQETQIQKSKFRNSSL